MTFVGILILQVLIGMIGAKITGNDEHPQQDDIKKTSKLAKGSYPMHARLVCIALAEEVVFRFLPVAAVELLGYGLEAKVLVSIHSTAIFGYLHGTRWQLRFATGSSGLIFSLFFLKLGGAGGEYLTALLWVGLLHASMNVLLVLVKNKTAAQ